MIVTLLKYIDYSLLFKATVLFSSGLRIVVSASSFIGIICPLKYYIMDLNN